MNTGKLMGWAISLMLVLALVGWGAGVIGGKKVPPAVLGAATTVQ